MQTLLEQSPIVLLASVSLGVILLAFQYILVRLGTQVKVFSDLARARPSMLVFFIFGSVIVGGLVTFLGGTDWLRWCSIYGGSFVITVGFMQLASQQSVGNMSDRRMSGKNWIFASILVFAFAVLPPLPHIATPDQFMTTVLPV